MTDSTDDPVVRIEPCSTISAITQVVFYQSTVDEKSQKHQELRETGVGVDELASTVSKPRAVYDGNVPGVTYVMVSADHNYAGHPLVVTAKRVSNTSSARFTSAYYTSKFNELDPIWPEGKD